MTSDPLNRGGGAGDSLATGASKTFDVDSVYGSTLVVQADMVGAADGDLTVQVFPFESDNTTVSAVELLPVNSSGPTFVTNRVCFYGQYDLLGLGKVRIVMTNHNAATKVLTRSSWVLA